MLTRRGLIGAAAGLVGAAAARPDPDFVDQDLTYQLAHNPRAVQIGVEKELIKRGGLRAYTPLAWPACEGSTFMGGWHIDAVLEFMENLIRGEFLRGIIMMPPRHMKPVAENQFVVTLRGRIRLKEVVVGDEILTHRCRFRRVSAVHDNGVLPTVVVVCTGWNDARMAPDHPVLAHKPEMERGIYGWIPAGQLAAGDTVITIPPIGRREPTHRLVGATCTRVIEAPRARCICLTVEEDASFTANNIVVHNSLSCAVMAPSWSWTVDPSLKWLFSSYAFALATRDSRKCRQIITSQWYRDRWGDRFRLLSDQNLKSRFANDKHGERICTAVRSLLTGEGGDVLVVDDPHNVRDAESVTKREDTLEWWDESMTSRLNDPRTGRKLIVAQRVAELDLIGHVLKKDKETKFEGVVEGWQVLCLPAEFEPDHSHRWHRDPRKEAGELLWPARFGPREVGLLKLGLGPYAAASQLQQNPGPREGGYFKRAWFLPWSHALPRDTVFVRAWDLAASVKKKLKSDPDWTASVLLGFSAKAKLWFIVDVARYQLEAGDVRGEILRIAAEDEAHFPGRVKIELPQDPGQAGKDQIQNLVQMLAGYVVHKAVVQGDKGVRAEPANSQAQMQFVRYIVGDWNTAFFNEICGFPTAAHDDMFDAFTTAFNALTGGKRGLIDYYMGLGDEDELPQKPVARGPKEGFGIRRQWTTTVIGEEPPEAADDE